ncbi:hypothetical protein BYT27DRAFT_7256675 [Phlegmacium glaucopus]|nr:hypothetical protein BYT27DRAFT_7256675 [Phlegmacium glaucopus]
MNETLTAIQAGTVESMEESAARSQLENGMVVLPSFDSDIQDTTLNHFGVTVEEMKPSDTELDFTTDVTPLTSSTPPNCQFSNDSCSRKAQEPEVAADFLEKPTSLSIAALIDLTLSSRAILTANDVMGDRQVVEVPVTDPTTTILSPSVEEADPVGEIPVVTNASLLHLHRFTKITIHRRYTKYRHESYYRNFAKGNAIAESTEVEGALRDIDAPVDAAISTTVRESTIADFEDIILTSDNISNPEAAPPQDNVSMITVEFNTGTTHVDEMPAELESSVIHYRL